MATKRPVKHLGDVLTTLLADKGLLSTARETDVMNRWFDIVGERIAKESQCTEVREGVLYVRVKAAAWRQEISFYKADILSQIREKSRCTTITDIVFY
jgi:predicted nucleic acid-binding Zn ribbon protein